MKKGIVVQFEQERIITGLSIFGKNNEYARLNVLDDTGETIGFFVKPEVAKKMQGVKPLTTANLLFESQYYKNNEGKEVSRWAVVDIL